MLPKQHAALCALLVSAGAAGWGGFWGLLGFSFDLFGAVMQSKLLPKYLFTVIAAFCPINLKASF